MKTKLILLAAIALGVAACSEIREHGGLQGMSELRSPPAVVAFV